MIREVKPDDAADIVTIYNRYIAETTVTFETVKLSTVQMQQRIKEISHHFPYYVYETEGKVVGYAYVHQWKNSRNHHISEFRCKACRHWFCPYATNN